MGKHLNGNIISGDGVNYILTGCKGRFLEHDEILKATDFIRDIYERPMMSQDGGWDTSFSPKGWRGPAWHRVETELTAWVGRTYNEYVNFASFTNVPIHEVFRIEKS